jgi:16S rRNA (guanine527-N7)-methyltransferase
MSHGLPPELIARWNVSRESLQKLEAYVGLLKVWQDRINLIGNSTIDDIWKRHITDALQLLPYLPPGPAPLADLGSGAGIPGLIIALATGRTVHLYESNTKKASFLREAIRTTAAPAVVHVTRIETLATDPGRPKVAAVMARAFAPLAKLLEMAEPFLRDGAIGLFHKGQDVDLELQDATSYWNVVCEKHPSLSDSRGVVLVVKEIARVSDGTKA